MTNNIPIVAVVAACLVCNKDVEVGEYDRWGSPTIYIPGVVECPHCNTKYNVKVSATLVKVALSFDVSK